MAPIAPFLCLPSEIRLQIYKLLLSNHDDKTLRIRTEEPSIYERRKHEKRQRCSFRFIADRMRSRSAQSTYTLQKAPGQSLHPSILAANHQIHAEASNVLYSEHTFEFCKDIESILPFLQDLTPVALASIKRINMTKRALPYTKDFDRCEWESACEFISQNMSLTRLDLGVLGGTPSLAGQLAARWESKDTFSQSDFGIISKLGEMEWAIQVGAIKGLKELNVRAVLEHCPIPCSDAMAFFVNFSASIEKGFAEWLKGIMIVPG